ncbi:hypothetical protein D3C87_1947600 [compost metagenome]
MHPNRQHAPACLLGFTDHVVDGGAAILGEVAWIAVARCDQIAAVVQGLRIGHDEKARSLMIEKIGKIVVAGI